MPDLDEKALDDLAALDVLLEEHDAATLRYVKLKEKTDNALAHLRKVEARIEEVTDALPDIAKGPARKRAQARKNPKR